MSTQVQKYLLRNHEKMLLLSSVRDQCPWGGQTPTIRLKNKGGRPSLGQDGHFQEKNSELDARCVGLSPVLLYRPF